MGSRKKNWSDKEDQLLADKVIQYTKIGKTQLEAFKDVSKELNRTPSACGYRWNAKLRSKYQEELKQIKEGRNPNLSTTKLTSEDKKTYTDPESPLQLALQYLAHLNKYQIHSLESIRELSELMKENEQLKKKLDYFKQAYSNAFSSTEKN